jgi:acetyl esterase/lipase
MIKIVALRVKLAVTANLTYGKAMNASRSPHHPSGTRKRRHPLLITVTALWASLTGFILICMVLPTMPNAGLFSVSVLAYTYNPFLLTFVLLGAVLIFLTWTRSLRAPLIIATALTLAMAVAVVVPSVRLANTAADNDVELSLPALFQSPQGGLTEPTDTTTYNTVDGQELKMDVWQPADQAQASHAALVYVYGGGFESGTREQWAAYFQHLTSQGITVFSMDYRLSTPTDPSWDKAGGDVKCAVGWVHQNADRYGIDTERVAISGGSAGGNLALLAAYSTSSTSESDAVPASCAVEDTSVRAVVDFYGPTDLVNLYEGTPSTPVKASLVQYLGGTPATQPDRYSTLSPINYVDENSPPTLIIQGLRDTGVQSEESINLAKSLDEAGVANELLLLPDTEHAFDAAFGSFANQTAQARISHFLQEHLID